jgi:peroxiredoxin
LPYDELERQLRAPALLMEIAMASSAPLPEFGWKAVDFALPATDGRMYRLTDIAGANGTLIVFICNHCPYVKAMIGRLVRDAAELQAAGIGTAAICSNDAIAYPEDGFDKMQAFAAEHRLPFPYLHDETQQVARAYGAVCTPDFFGFNANGELQYRGRLDEGRIEAPAGAKRELLEAMQEIARTGIGPREQVASIGCSIKWTTR